MAGQFHSFGLTPAGPNQFSFSTHGSAGLPHTAYLAYPTAVPAPSVQTMGYPTLTAGVSFSPQQAPGSYNYAVAGCWPQPGVQNFTAYYAPPQTAPPSFNRTIPTINYTNPGVPTNLFSSNSHANKQRSTGQRFGKPPALLGLRRQNNPAPIFQPPVSVLTQLTGPEMQNNTSNNKNTGAAQTKGPRRPFDHTSASKIRRAIFCDFCKISCAGQLTYKEHVEGQRHKKKVAQVEKGEEEVLARNKITYKCEICGVVCPGNDTYQAHIKGIKHQRALKIHLTMGKSLSTTEPTIITPHGMIRNSSTLDDSSNSAADVIAMYEKDVEPVGLDYVDVQGEGKAVSYHCKLCDCRFNDPNAKDAHLKGRRHRLQYKKKVDPSIEVDIKYNPRDRRSIHSEPSSNAYPVTPTPLFGRLNFPQNSLLSGENYLFVAHEALKLGDKEMLAVEKAVTNAETALKLVSDNFTQKNPDAGKVESGTGAPSDDRLLKGVMRVGDMAKQLMIRGQLNVDLVVLCACKPTGEILDEIGQKLPIHLAEVTEDKYEICTSKSNANVVLFSQSEPKVQITVALTSVAMRDASEEDLDINKQQGMVEQPNILDKNVCLEALANLRRAKWFQAQCLPHSALLIVLRILKDFRRRTPTWHFLPLWPLELLVERIFAAAGYTLSPSQAFRHVFETISSGLFFNDCHGLLDPCERDRVDAVSCLSSQQREDLAFSAQLNDREFKSVCTCGGTQKLKIDG